MSLYEHQITDRLGVASGLPREAMLDIAPKAMPATTRVVAVIPNTSSSIGPSQTVQFQIPARGMMKSHSCFLKFKFTPTTNAAYSFSGAAASAAALINSIQIQSGSVILENLLNYHHWHNNVILPHALNIGSQNVESICSGAFSAAQINAATYSTATATGGFAGITDPSANLPNASGTAINFTIPIYSGIFNNRNQTSLPLFATNGLLVTIQTNPVTKAFYGSTSNAVTDYTMSEFEFEYQEVVPDQEYVNSVMSSLKQGKLIKIEADSYLNVQTSYAASLRQMFSLNMSSLNSVLFGYQDADAVNSNKWFHRTVNLDSDDTASRREIYLDNNLLYNY